MRRRVFVGPYYVGIGVSGEYGIYDLDARPMLPLWVVDHYHNLPVLRYREVI